MYLILYNLKKPEPILTIFGTQYSDKTGFYTVADPGFTDGAKDEAPQLPKLSDIGAEVQRRRCKD